MALKSTEEEHAILRARSAVQRFPVVEWRQRMGDFHKRSINFTSRQIAGSLAWRPSDGEAEHREEPTQPNWDTRSTYDSPHNSITGSPGAWSHSTLVPLEQHLLPPRTLKLERRGSASSDVSEGEDYFARAECEYGRLLRSLTGTSWL